MIDMESDLKVRVDCGRRAGEAPEIVPAFIGRLDGCRRRFGTGGRGPVSVAGGFQPRACERKSRGCGRNRRLPVFILRYFESGFRRFVYFRKPCMGCRGTMPRVVNVVRLQEVRAGLEDQESFRNM